jgi:hypothetical protein
VIEETSQEDTETATQAITCPSGYEPDVFYSLPEFMQQEIVDQYQGDDGEGEVSEQVRGLIEVGRS